VFSTYTTRHGLGHDLVYAICEAPDGGLWVGTSGGGVSRLEDGHFTTYRRAQGLSSDVVRALYCAEDGSVWIGTYGGGLNRLRNGTVQALTTKDGLPNDIVFAILPARAGGLWIGTYGGGLARLQDGRLRAYGSREGLSNDYVLALHEDGDGVLWIGTFGGGLVRLKDGRFRSYTTKDGLYDDVVYQILEDSAGYLWMGSDKGVFRVSKQSLAAHAQGGAPLSFTSYGRADGMKSSQCISGAQPAGLRTRDGRLWFPTTRGVAVVDPGQLKVDARPPPVVIEEVLVDGRAIGPERPPPGRGRLEIRYTALSFVSPEKVQFRYRLAGFDDDWVDAGSRRTAYYTNLPPGAYEFRVTASNADGVWNETGAALRVEIAPHFYETRWFYALVVLAMLLVGAGIYHVRVLNLRRRERELARRVDEALARIQVLDGLLPICAWCKKVRDDKGYWNQIEAYVSTHSRAEFTHGICPECSSSMLSKDRSAAGPASGPAS
jgi:hypothetical protein